jgi:hypothetical protein
MSLQKKNKYIEKVTEEIGLDGDVKLRSKTFKVEVKVYEDYFLTFAQNYTIAIKKLSKAKDIHLLAEILLRLEFNTNMLYLTTARRKEIKEQAGIRSDTTLYSALKTLINLDIMRGDRGTFQISPMIFWKGSYAKHAMALKQWIGNDVPDPKTPKVNLNDIHSDENEPLEKGN